MDFPTELRNIIDIKATAWKPSELKKASAAITDRYKNDSGKGKSLVTSSLDSLVYSIVRMPATFAAVSEALSYALEIVGEDHSIRSILDVGAGTGAAAWAASSLLDLEEIVCLEREKAMSTIGMELMQSGYSVLRNAKWISADITAKEFPYKADLVTASYVLNEMTDSDRTAAVKKLWSAAEHMLLLIEPGTPVGFAQLNAAREILLSEGAHIAAPCPHEKNCRLADNDWCHFTARVQRNKLHKMLKSGDAPYEDEKFFYMAFVREDTEKHGARILRHPYIEKGKITLELCTENENKTTVITKKQGELFKSAKKSKCGDLL